MSELINPNELLKTIQTPLVCNDCKSTKKKDYVITLFGELGEVKVFCESCVTKLLKKKMIEIVKQGFDS